jgi:hypothetical protein
MGKSPNAINESGPTFWERPHTHPPIGAICKARDHPYHNPMVPYPPIGAIGKARDHPYHNPMVPYHNPNCAKVTSEEEVVIYSRTDLTLSLNTHRKFTRVFGRAHSKKRNLTSEKCQGLLRFSRRALSFAVVKYFVCVSRV